MFVFLTRFKSCSSLHSFHSPLVEIVSCIFLRSKYNHKTLGSIEKHNKAKQVDKHDQQLQTLDIPLFTKITDWEADTKRSCRKQNCVHHRNCIIHGAWQVSTPERLPWTYQLKDGEICDQVGLMVGCVAVMNTMPFVRILPKFDAWFLDKVQNTE